MSPDPVSSLLFYWINPSVANIGSLHRSFRCYNSRFQYYWDSNHVFSKLQKNIIPLFRLFASLHIQLITFMTKIAISIPGRWRIKSYSRFLGLNVQHVTGSLWDFLCRTKWVFWFFASPEKYKKRSSQNASELKNRNPTTCGTEIIDETKLFEQAL